MRILSLDVGTSLVKAAVLDVERAAPDGPVANVPYALLHPVPEAAEVLPDVLWSAVANAAREAVRGLDGIEGVGLSCMAPALILLGDRDKPLVPICTPLERRARQAARQVWAAVGEEFLHSTGIRPLPGGCSAVSYRQLLSADPYLIREVRSYLHVNSWLGLKLTGEKRFDPANASLSGLFSTLTDRQWSPRWLELFNVDPAWLPPVVCASTTLGSLRPAAAAELGISPGLPVKLGTCDTSSAMLAAAMKPGDLLLCASATNRLSAIAEKPLAGDRRMTHLLGVGGIFAHVTYNPVGGDALDWMYELCFRDQTKEQFLTQTIADALGRTARVTLDPPHLGGDPLEIEAHRAAFRGLTLSSGRMDLLAALLHEMRRQHEKAIEALGVGNSFRRIILAGESAELMKGLLPDCAAAETLDDGSLRGVAQLFRQG